MARKKLAIKLAAPEEDADAMRRDTLAGVLETLLGLEELTPGLRRASPPIELEPEIAALFADGVWRIDGAEWQVRFDEGCAIGAVRRGMAGFWNDAETLVPLEAGPIDPA